MTKKELAALLDYIDARIDEKIGDAFFRDTGHECLRAMELKKDLEARILTPGN